MCIYHVKYLTVYTCYMKHYPADNLIRMYSHLIIKNETSPDYIYMRLVVDEMILEQVLFRVYFNFPSLITILPLLRTLL
jgi:hypothetical protein